MTTSSKYFPPQTSDDHYVEIVETATGKVEKRMGPMSERKAEKVEMGALHRIDLELFFVRTGTDAALKKEAEPSRAKPAGSSPALRIACPVCGVAAGAYCLKNGRNEVQVIAHKRRREEEERTR